MIAYYKLLDYLNRHGIGKEEFRKKVDIAPATMAKITKNEPISLTVIDRICKELQCQPGNIIEYVEREEIEPGTIKETVPMENGENYVSFFPDEETYSPEYRLYMEHHKNKER